jgi:hypothetical protein
VKSTLDCCLSCGGKLEYVAGNGLTCDECRHVRVLAGEGSPSDQDVFALIGQIPELCPPPETLQLECDHCGMITQLAPNQFAGHCPGCTYPFNVLGSSARSLRPTGMLPCRLTAAQTGPAFQKWVRRRVFAPSNLRRTTADRFRLHYRPMLVFAGQTETRYQGERGDVRKVGKQRRTTWSSVSGTVTWSFSGLAVDVTHGPAVQRRKSWPTDEAVGYLPEYLAGADAFSYSGGPKAAAQVAEKTIDAEVRALVKSSIGGRQQRIRTLSTGFDRYSLRYILAPVWSSTYHYRGKPYEVAINARTGEVAGRHPYSAPRVGLAVAMAASIAALAIVGIGHIEANSRRSTDVIAVCTDANAIWQDLDGLSAESSGLTSTQLQGEAASDPVYAGATFQSDARGAGSTFAGIAGRFASEAQAGSVNQAIADLSDIAAACTSSGQSQEVQSISGTIPVAPGGPIT